jgi:hypothetical protein
MKRSAVLMPAVWMRASGVPCSRTDSRAVVILDVSATSQTRGMMLGERAAASSSDSSVRPRAKVLAPASAKRLAGVEWYE